MSVHDIYQQEAQVGLRQAFSKIPGPVHQQVHDFRFKSVVSGFGLCRQISALCQDHVLSAQVEPCPQCPSRGVDIDSLFLLSCASRCSCQGVVDATYVKRLVWEA